MCNNHYWLLRVHTDWLIDWVIDVSLLSSPPTYNYYIGLSDFLNSWTLTCAHSNFWRELHHFRVCRCILVTLCFCWQWLLLTCWSVTSAIGLTFVFCLRNNATYTRWALPSRMSFFLTNELDSSGSVSFFVPFLSNKTTNVFCDWSFFIRGLLFWLHHKLDVICEACVTYPGRTPKQKTKSLFFYEIVCIPLLSIYVSCGPCLMC